jgi:hypothetical protein
MSMPRTIAFLVTVSGSLLFVPSGTYQSTSFAQQTNPPYLVCGGAADIECSYILWDANGSKGFVVPPQTANYPISDQYLGFKFCMHAGHPHVSMPKWPECFGKPNTPENTNGTIGRGKNG